MVRWLLPRSFSATWHLWPRCLHCDSPRCSPVARQCPRSLPYLQASKDLHPQLPLHLYPLQLPLIHLLLLLLLSLQYSQLL